MANQKRRDRPVTINILSNIRIDLSNLITFPEDLKTPVIIAVTVVVAIFLAWIWLRV